MSSGTMNCFWGVIVCQWILLTYRWMPLSATGFIYKGSSSVAIGCHLCSDILEKDRAFLYSIVTSDVYICMHVIPYRWICFCKRASRLDYSGPFRVNWQVHISRLCFELPLPLPLLLPLPLPLQPENYFRY